MIFWRRILRKDRRLDRIGRLQAVDVHDDAIAHTLVFTSRRAIDAAKRKHAKAPTTSARNTK